MAPCRKRSRLSEVNLCICTILGEQCFITALDMVKGLSRLTRFMPVVGQRGALMIGALFLCATALCLSMIATQSSSHNRPIDISVAFLLSGHVWAVLFFVDMDGKFGSSPEVSGITYLPLDNNTGAGLGIIDLLSMGQLDVPK